MNPMISSFLVFLVNTVLLNTVQVQSASLDERVSYLEMLDKEKSMRLFEQHMRLQSIHSVILRMQENIRTITQSLSSVMATSQIQNDEISLLKRILRKHSSFSEHKIVQNATHLPRDIQNVYPDTSKKSKIEKSTVPMQRGHLPGDLTHKAAFCAYMSQGENAPGKHQTIIFNVAITNTDNAYNHYTGTFMAPFTAIYVFTCSIRMTCNAKGSFEFVHNAQAVGSVYSSHLHDCDVDTFTGTIVIHINQGDVVFVRTHPVASIAGHIESTIYGRSSFCGWSI